MRAVHEAEVEAGNWAVESAGAILLFTKLRSCETFIAVVAVLESGLAFRALLNYLSDFCVFTKDDYIRKIEIRSVGPT
jgi:hypothetical protein